VRSADVGQGAAVRSFSITRRPRLRRDGESWWRVGGALLAAACTAGGTVAGVLHYVGAPWQPIIVLTTFGHQLMWAAPAGLLGALLVRRWVVAAVAGAATVLVAAIQVPPTVATASASGRPLVVLQANLRVGGADPAALVETVRRDHVDLLATEELTASAQEGLLAAGLAGHLPYRYTAPLPDGGGGIGIWSRYPLREPRNLPHFQLGVLTAELATPGRDVTVVAAHLVPPWPYPSHIWRTEIDALGRVLHSLPGPVVVAGDFNATVDHAQFRGLLTHGYADAAGQAGAGYLPTYPTDRWFGPLIGIDHVLVRGGVTAASVRSLGIRGSDHRALLADLRLG
jgi:endonuclease/exonuclease/phosphatase (EEP) superfamily protein YafD